MEQRHVLRLLVDPEETVANGLQLGLVASGQGEPGSGREMGSEVLGGY
ncbi:hypothetical protein ACH5A3_44290 [Streptomyces echinatus]